MAVRKVLITTYLNASSVGGVSTHIGLLERGLKHLGIKTVLVDGSQGVLTVAGKARALVRSLGRRDAYRAGVTIGARKKLVHSVIRAAQAFQPDIIHAHDIYIMSALSVSELESVPRVLTVHGPALREAVMSGVASEGSRMASLIADLEQKAFSVADHIIAVDTLQRDLVLAQDVPSSKLTVLHNAVDLTEFDGCRGMASRPYILVPRRLVPKNGVHVAIEAFAAVHRKVPEVSLWIAGDGPLMGELRALADNLGVLHRTRFLGNVARCDMLTLVAGAQLILIPSVPCDGVVEATSIAALEGMAAGKPVIASNIGGLTELIKDGVDGKLVTAGDSERFAIEILSVLRNPASASVMGCRAREKVMREFSVETWVQRIVEIYEHVLQRKRIG